MHVMEATMAISNQLQHDPSYSMPDGPSFQPPSGGPRRDAHSIVSALLAATAFLAATDASATDYSLWIHGRNSHGAEEGNYADFVYWGPADVDAGVNKKAVNWDGEGHISATNFRIRNALDCFCTGENFCYIAAHSAGNAQIGYALAMYGNTARRVTTTGPNSAGFCDDAGDIQTGWNIYWIDIASGAAGGSELADVGVWFSGEELTQDLRTGTMRSLYNHNNTEGHWLFMFAGAKGKVWSAFLPGQDDGAVAYHSTGGLSSTGNFCNPGDWFCAAPLEYGTDDSGGTEKWSYHSVSLRDDDEVHTHGTSENWAGIVGPVREDMAEYAY
jgi:hypothetical protein